MTAHALSAEQAAVFETIEGTRENIFVTGRAGTGKSTLLNPLSWNTAKQLVIAAPTGVAALNVGGQTIHSLFRLPIGVIADHDIEQNADLRKLLNTIDTLVIDEVSMVNADLLDAVDRSLRQARQRKEEAFGGVQVVLFGDPYQLAPVPGDADERAYFEDQYRSMWFFDAKVWDETDLRIFELNTIHRQHEEEFKAMLNAVRHGTVTAEIAERFNAVGARQAPGSDAITLATRNDTVNRINAFELAKLPGRALSAVAEITGDFGGRAFPADETLELKVGARDHLEGVRRGGRGDARGGAGGVGEVQVLLLGRHEAVVPGHCRRVHAVPAAARLGCDDPQVPGQDLRPGDRRPRATVVRAGPDLCGVEPHHRAGRAVPHEAAAAIRHHRRRERAPLHGERGAHSRYRGLSDSLRGLAPRLQSPSTPHRARMQTPSGPRHQPLW